MCARTLGIPILPYIRGHVGILSRQFEGTESEKPNGHPVLSSALLRSCGNLFGGSRSGFRPPAKSDRLEVRIGDRHHFGLLTGMTSDL